MTEIKEIIGINSFSNIDLSVKKGDDFDPKILETFNLLFIKPSLKNIERELSKLIYQAYLNGELEGLNTFLFTLKTQLKKHDGNLEGFYRYELVQNVTQTSTNIVE